MAGNTANTAVQQQVHGPHNKEDAGHWQQCAQRLSDGGANCSSTSLSYGQGVNGVIVTIDKWPA